MCFTDQGVRGVLPVMRRAVRCCDRHHHGDPHEPATDVAGVSVQARDPGVYMLLRATSRTRGTAL